MIITIRKIESDGRSTFWRANVTLTFARKHDNGCLVSIGWRTGDESADLPIKSFEYLRRSGRLSPMTETEWKHSGCQSYCTERGHTRCVW